MRILDWLCGQCEGDLHEEIRAHLSMATQDRLRRLIVALRHH